MKLLIKHIGIILLVTTLFIGFQTNLLGNLSGKLKNNKTPFFKTIKCGDLLERYAEKPKNLEFIKCKKIYNNQTIIEAEYRVSGEESEKIETFLVNKYGLGKLKWVCCGWQSQGKYGGFDNKEITKINPNYSVIIQMYASADIFDKDGKHIGLEFNRSKVKYFTVLVKVVDV